MNALKNRKPNRLTDFDYSTSGAYFITICTKEHKCIFSSICRDSPCGCPKIKYTELGKIAINTICDVEEKFNIKIAEFTVMPNHIHMIIIIDDNIRTAARAVPTVSRIVGAYKSIVSYEYLKVCKNKGINMGIIWQKSFYDHIIRDEEDYIIKAQYIKNNPVKWLEDKYYTKN